MYNILLQKAFEKAQDQIHSDKPTHLSRYLSDYILEDGGIPFGEKSLRNYYKNAIKGEVVDLKPFVVEALCRFIGFDNYNAYILKHPISRHRKKLQHTVSFTSQSFMMIFMAFFFHHLFVFIS